MLKHVPRQDFENTEAWAEAMSKVIKEVLLPSVVAILDEKAKAKILQSKPPSDELFDRELRFDERNEAALQRAIDRLLELKKAKRLVSFRAIQRFERTHPERLGKTIIVQQKSHDASTCNNIARTRSWPEIWANCGLRAAAIA